MKFSNLVISAAVTTAAALSLVGSASANTGVVNEYVNGTRHVRNNTQISNIRVEAGTTNKFSNSSKIETNFPTAFGGATINNGLTTNNIQVSTNGPDPFVATSYSESTEIGTFKDVTKVNVNETSTGTDRIYRHTVSSQF